MAFIIRYDVRVDLEDSGSKLSDQTEEINKTRDLTQDKRGEKVKLAQLFPPTLNPARSRASFNSLNSINLQKKCQLKKEI